MKRAALEEVHPTFPPEFIIDKYPSRAKLSINLIQSGKKRMDLLTIVSLEKWEAFEKEIHKRSGMNASVYDNKGSRITSYVSWANEVCPIIKAYPEGIDAICAVANQYFMTEMAETKQPLVDECDAGFIKFAAPIIYRQEFLGTVGGCGHLLPGGEVETFYIKKIIGKNDSELDVLASKTKITSEGRIQSFIDYIQTHLNEILPD